MQDKTPKPEQDKETKNLAAKITFLRAMQMLVLLNVIMIIPEWSERDLSVRATILYGLVFLAFLGVAEIMVRRFKKRLADRMGAGKS